jgi:hypothetical protein
VWSQAWVAAAGSNELGFSAEILAAGGGVDACCACAPLESAIVRQTPAKSDIKLKRLIMNERNNQPSNKRKARSPGTSAQLLSFIALD